MDTKIILILIQIQDQIFFRPPFFVNFGRLETKKKKTSEAIG